MLRLLAKVFHVFPSTESFAVTPSYFLTILSVVSIVCKLYIFRITLAILLFEGVCSFYITGSSKSTTSYFYFSCVLLSCIFNKSGLEIVQYMSNISRYLDNVCVKK